MRHLKSNPETLLLINPGKPKRKTKKKVTRRAKPKAAPKAKVKAKAKKAKSKKTSAAAKAAAKIRAENKRLKEQLKKAKQEAKMARGRKNPPRKKKPIKRKKRVLRGSAAAQVKSLQAQLKAAKSEVKQEKAKAKRGPSKAMQRWAYYAEVFGTDVEGAKRRFGTLGEARKAEMAAKREAREAEKLTAMAGKFEDVAAKLGITPEQAKLQFGTLKAARQWLTAERKAKTAMRKKVAASKKKVRKKKAETKAQLAKRVAEFVGTDVKALEGYTVADLRRLKKAYQVEYGQMLPRGTSITGLPGYPPAPGPMPSGAPAEAMRHLKHLAVPSDWRPPIFGRQDAGWWWQPPTQGKYKFVRNPPKKKAKKKRAKPSAIKKYMGKLPIVGKPAVKFFYGKKGKKNPKFSLGEIAKITVAGGVGFVGGTTVTGFATGLVESAGLSGKTASIAGGAATIGLTHVLFKDSDYYVPVMAGVGIAAAREIMGGELPGEEAGEGWISGAVSKVKGMLPGAKNGNGEEGMGYVASDDELLSSIDAGMEEYIDIPMEEYVETSPMGGFTEAGNLGDSFDNVDSAIDPALREYVDTDDDYDDELEEYIETSPMGDYGYELEEYIETSPMGLADYVSPDAADDDEMDEELEGLAAEYTDDVPGVPYGGMTEAEELDFESQPALSAYEELAGDFDDDIFDDDEYADEAIEESMGGYEELADETAALASYEELADETAALADDYEELGESRRARRLRRRARRMRRRRGRARRGRALRARRRTIRKRGRRAWMKRLRRQAVGQKVVGNFRAQVQAAVMQATKDTPFETGSKKHFRAAFIAFRQRAGGGRIGRGMRRAFLVAYRAATRGKSAAMTAAKISGVPAQVAGEIAKTPPVSAAAVARGELSPGQIERRGGAFVRRIRPQARTRRVRRPGQRRAPRFGGIFRQSIFGERSRWR